MQPNKRRRLNKPVCHGDSDNDQDMEDYFNRQTSIKVNISSMNKSNGFDNTIGIDVFKSIILPFLMYYERCAISRVCKLFAFVCPTHFDQPLTKNNNKNGKQNSKNGNWRYSRCVDSDIILDNNNKMVGNEEMIFEKSYWENHLSFELTNGSYFGNKFNLSNGKLLKFYKIYKNQEIYQMLKYFIIYQDFIGINMSLILLSNMREIDLSNNVNIQLLSTIIKLQSKKNNPLPKRFNGFLTKCPKFPTILNNNNSNNSCNNSSSSNNGDSMMLNGIKECDLTETMIENRNILVSFMIDIFRFKKYDFNKKMSMTTLKSINLSNNYLNDECLYNILINGLKMRVINDIMSPINCFNNNNNNSNNQNGENETFCKNTKNENNNNNNNRKISEKCKIMEKMNDKAENHKNKMLKEEARWLHIGLQNMKSNNNILGNNNSFFMLTKLDLSNNLFITDKYMPLLFNEIIPNKLPYLQNINLSNNNLTNQTCSVVYNYYKNFHNNSFLILINLKNNKNITINGVKSYINLIFDNNYLPNGNPRTQHSFKIYFSQSILVTNATDNNNNNNNDTKKKNNSQANKQSNFNHFNGINFNNNNNNHNNNIGIDWPADKQIIQWHGNDKIIFE